MKIQKLISDYNNQSRYGESIEWVVIHYVGAVSTAHDNARYFAGGDRQASAHYFVDEDEIWQSVEESRGAWHCGGPLQGSGGHRYFQICTNRNSIGIEMCVIRKNGKYIVKDGTIKNTTWLVKKLMKKYNINKSHVIRHYDVTGKDCPDASPEYDLDANLLGTAAWNLFRDKITGNYVKSKLTLTGANYPETLKKGERFVIKGTVKSAAKLKSVTVVVEKASSGEDIRDCTKRRYTSAKSYNLTKTDPYIAFRKLPAGSYVYRIKAEDVNGTKKTLLRRPFKVVK